MAEEKKTVTMTNRVALPDGRQAVQQAVDHVPVDQLDDYVADARTRWAEVEVSDEE